MAQRTRRRSRRSHVIEIGVTVLALVALYLFVAAGGAAWFGEWFAGRMTGG